MPQDATWYYAIDGKQHGPYTKADLRGRLERGEIREDTFVYTPGMAGWEPVGRLGGFREDAASPPPPPSGRRSDVIDYEIHGEEMQFVEITLDPGEATIAEAGAFMYMDPGIEMETIFGDGSHRDAGGFLGKLMTAGKRVLTGESLFMTLFGNAAPIRQKVAFASPYPGRVIPVDLLQHGGHLMCQKQAFLCAAKGVHVGIAFQKKVGAGLFGGEGFILQSLEGDGLAFVHAGGHVVARDLGPGEQLRLDTGCLVGFEPQVTYDVEFVKGIKTALFGGEGLFFATLRGPGRIWIQSLPFSRLASRVWAAAPQSGGKRVGEGSILDRVGGLGRLIDGD